MRKRGIDEKKKWDANEMAAYPKPSQYQIRLEIMQSLKRRGKVYIGLRPRPKEMTKENGWRASEELNKLWSWRINYRCRCDIVCNGTEMLGKMENRKRKAKFYVERKGAVGWSFKEPRAIALQTISFSFSQNSKIKYILMLRSACRVSHIAIVHTGLWTMPGDGAQTATQKV